MNRPLPDLGGMPALLSPKNPPKKKKPLPDLNNIEKTVVKQKSVSPNFELSKKLTLAFEVYEIPLPMIESNPANGRKVINPDAVSRMAASINAVGFRGVVEVFLNPDTDKYQLIYGELRKRGAIQAGMNTVPCKIIDNEKAQTRRSTSFLENFTREGITKIEEAQELEALKEEFDGVKNVQIAEMLNISESEVSRLFDLLKLPQAVQLLMLNKQLSYSHAREIIPLKDAASQIEVATAVTNNNLTVKELKAVLKKQSTEKGADEGYFLDKGEVSTIEKNFSRQFEFPVKLKLDKKGGATFSVKCSSKFEFERLREILKKLD